MAPTWVCFGLLAIAGITAAFQTEDECSRDFVTTMEPEGRRTQYKIVPSLNLKTKESAFIFSVSICRNARIRLLPSQEINGDAYNINIDTDVRDNKRFTNIIRRNGEDYVYSKRIPYVNDNKVACQQSRDFYITWDYNTGRLALGTGHDVHKNEYAYMIFRDDVKLDIQYVAVSPENNPTYKIYKQCPLPPVEPACSSASDCQENEKCQGGKCVACPEGTMLNGGECKPVCISDSDCDSDSACDYEDNVCKKCPSGTAPRVGRCDETCSSSQMCSNVNEGCLDGFCEPCAENEQVVDGVCVSICDLRKNEGDCSNKVTRYFYKASSLQCNEFEGCAGDDGNSFATKEECKGICEAKNIPPECLLNTDPGTCEGYTRRYYYDKELMACKKFEFNGCGGNANNFLSKDDCRAYCAKYD